MRCEEYLVCELFLSSTYYVDTIQCMFQEENDDMTSPGLRESPQHKNVDVHNVTELRVDNSSVVGEDDEREILFVKSVLNILDWPALLKKPQR